MLVVTVPTFAAWFGTCFVHQPPKRGKGSR